ncbi:MAG: phage tail protein [Muribaculaceae bacterium]|nr:phage tail protein [Muribaculaceae bacterium]
MLITLYDRSGEKKAELSPNDSSTQVKEIQGDNVLTLSFTHWEHIDLDVDDYADFEGERYWLTERYRPKQNSTKEWVYDIKLYGTESMIKRLLVLKSVDGEEEPVFTLTAPAREHVAMIVKCMNDGMGNITDWKVGQVDGTENIVIDYFGKYCDEALKEIAEKVGAEWWVEGTTVNVCRCEHGEPLHLGYNKGLTSIQPDTADNVKFYTRLYPKGSSRNIDREKYGHARLQLPDGAKYVEVNADKYGRVDHYEEDAFADIYPRRVGEVSSEVKTGEDGKPFTIWYFRDDELPFDPNDYEIANLVKRVSFQEGSELVGLGDEDGGTYYFEVNYESKSGEFEIITTWPYDDGTQLPGVAGSKLVPKVGDRYVLWNIRMPDEYYGLAEEEFLAAVDRYNAEHALDIAVYRCPTDHVWIEEQEAELQVGRRVILESDEYFPEAGCRESRITRITRRVNLPTQMDIEIGDALGRTSQQKLTDSINEARAYAAGTAGGGGLPDIIRTGDRTVWTDNNLLSARRAMAEFLSKTRPDVAEKLIRFIEGLEVGDWEPGVSGLKAWTDAGGDTWIETDNVRARKKAFFKSLAIEEAEYVGGELVLTPGGGIECTEAVALGRVDGRVRGWRCLYMSRDTDGKAVHCRIRERDLVKCQTFNLGHAGADGSYSDAENRYYWREVTAVGDPAAEADIVRDEQGREYCYIELGNLPGEYDPVGTDAPAEGDSIVQLGNRDDALRQKAIIISTTDTSSPSVRMFTGIDDFTLRGRMEVGLGVDETGKVYFRLGESGASQYLDYRQGQGLEVAGRISVRSTIGDTPIEDALKGTYRMELTPGALAVPCNADGDISQDEAMPAVEVTVYKGNQMMTQGRVNGYEAGTPAGTGLSFYRDTASPGVRFRLSDGSAMPADTATATCGVTVYENGREVATLVSAVSVYKVRPGQAGIPGESALRLVPSRDVVTIPCNANGVVTANGGQSVSDTLRSTTRVSLRLYKGSKLVGEPAYSKTSESNCTALLNNGVLYITQITADTAYVTVRGADSDGSYAEATVNFSKLKQGAAGEAAVVYTIEPSAQIIKKGPDDTFSPASLTCTVYETTGSEARKATDARPLYYRRNKGGTLSGWAALTLESGISGVVAPAAGDTELIFGLFSDTTAGRTLLAQARVPVLADAEDWGGNGINLLRDTNQGARHWEAGVHYENATTYPNDPNDYVSLGEGAAVPPGVLLTNGYMYPYGFSKTDYIPTSINYQMFFAAQEGLRLELDRKYTLSFEMTVEYTGTNLGYSYGLNRWVSSARPQNLIGGGRLPAQSTRARRTMAVSHCFVPSEINTGWDMDGLYTVGHFNLNVDQSETRTDSSTAVYSVEVRNVKLEAGTAGTGWTPSPHDVNYLMQAFKENTTIEGGVIMTSRVRVGYTNSQGIWTETGGLNGAVTNVSGTVQTDAPILYCGGQMVDRASSASDGAATSMIRLDGTAYFCANTVRMLPERMEVGDGVVLDAGGLHLYDADGRERLSVRNGPVGDLNGLDNLTPIAVEGNVQGTMALYCTERDSGTGIRPDTPGHYLKSYSSSGTVSIGSGLLGNDYRLSVTVEARFTLTPWGTGMKADVGLSAVLYRQGATGSAQRVATSALSLANSGNVFTGRAALALRLEKGWRYYIRIEGSAASVSNAANMTGVSCVTTVHGSATPVIHKTVLGDDGFVSGWGSGVVHVKEDEVNLVNGDCRMSLRSYNAVEIAQGNATLSIYTYGDYQNAHNEVMLTLDSGMDSQMDVKLTQGMILLRTAEMNRNGDFMLLDLAALKDKGFLK